MSVTAQTALLLATLLCSLVAGFLFAFAVVVMPGIKSLRDRDFLHAFRAVDGVIQRGDPLFGLVWVGSALAVAAGLALGAGQVDGLERMLLVLASGVYLLGVQLPTFIVNIPLNREVQALDLEGADGTAWRSARERFEPRWNRWNRIRTMLAILSAGIFLVLLLRL